MQNRQSLAHAAYDPRDLLAQFAASQRRQLADLREIAAILDPAPENPYACEICGRVVPVEQMSGFAARNGAVIHINCLTAQMSARVPK